MLGSREPEVYGSLTLAAINDSLKKSGHELGVNVECFQSNSESALLDQIQAAPQAGFSGIVINPAAYGHTSIALRDALLACALPFIEVHMTNTFSRESFRHKSYLADRASGVVIGFGAKSYLLALKGLAEMLLGDPAATL